MKEKTFVEQEYERERSMGTSKTFMERVRNKFTPKSISSDGKKRADDIEEVHRIMKYGLVTYNEAREMVGLQNIYTELIDDAIRSIEISRKKQLL